MVILDDAVVVLVVLLVVGMLAVRIKELIFGRQSDISGDDLVKRYLFLKRIGRIK